MIVNIIVNVHVNDINAQGQKESQGQSQCQCQYQSQRQCHVKVKIDAMALSILLLHCTASIVTNVNDVIDSKTNVDPLSISRVTSVSESAFKCQRHARPLRYKSTLKVRSTELQYSPTIDNMTMTKSNTFQGC